MCSFCRNEENKTGVKRKEKPVTLFSAFSFLRKCCAVLIKTVAPAAPTLFLFMSCCKLPVLVANRRPHSSLEEAGTPESRWKMIQLGTFCRDFCTALNCDTCPCKSTKFHWVPCGFICSSCISVSIQMLVISTPTLVLVLTNISVIDFFSVSFVSGYCACIHWIWYYRVAH